MPNRSKTNDPRFWNIWRLAGAVGGPTAPKPDTSRHIFESAKDIDGVVMISRNLYAKTPRALKKLLKLLRLNGYALEDLRQDKHRLSQDVSARDMELKGWSLWYASHPEYSNPLRPSMSIFEAWHWAPLPQSTKLHEKIFRAVGMVSRCDYYYQDGRKAFYDEHLAGMRLFVEHFTQLRLADWDRMAARASRSGPGMIKAIAKLCHPQAEVEDGPNIGNLLVGVSKMMSGNRLTEGEIRAMARATGDPETSNQFKAVMGAVSRRH